MCNGIQYETIWFGVSLKMGYIIPCKSPSDAHWMMDNCISLNSFKLQCLHHELRWYCEYHLVRQIMTNLSVKFQVGLREGMHKVSLRRGIHKNGQADIDSSCFRKRFWWNWLKKSDVTQKLWQLPTDAGCDPSNLTERADFNQLIWLQLRGSLVFPFRWVLSLGIFQVVRTLYSWLVGPRSAYNRLGPVNAITCCADKKGHDIENTCSIHLLIATASTYD